MSLKNKLRERAQKLTSDTAALFLAFKRKDTPVIVKIIIGIAICYALSPIDFIPDFIPVIGLLDDLIILPALIALAIRFIPIPIMSECREQSSGMWADGKPKSFKYALIIVVIWLIIIALIVKAIWF